jgi:hypothetical protein
MGHITKQATQVRCAASRNLQFDLFNLGSGGFGRCGLRNTSLVLLDALESLFKLGDKRSFTRLETALPHDAPEVIATGHVRIVDGHYIFGWSACHKDDDVGLGGLVHKC